MAGKGSPKKSKAPPSSQSPTEGASKPPVEVLEREAAARLELEKLSDELALVKKEVARLRKENEWLKDEANQTKMESHEYLQYMSRKSQKRQTTIAALNHRNTLEINKIEAEKLEIVKKYENRKHDLNSQIMTKEEEFTEITRDLQDLAEYQAFRLEQEAEIERLEAEVERLKTEHADKLQAMKTDFLKEREAHEKDANLRIKEMEQLANTEALSCLVGHTHRINQENKELRKELLALIRKSQSLTKHKMELVNQHKTLLREHQITKDLKKLRQVHIE